MRNTGGVNRAWSVVPDLPGPGPAVTKALWPPHA
jgi:hypothetical protein